MEITITIDKFPENGLRWVLVTKVRGRRNPNGEGWSPPEKEEARACVERKGQRFTAQRAAVYDYLKAVHHHPTAEEVYMAVKRRMPRVSLATVYNALEVLADCGLASTYTSGNASTRYDIRTDPHSHARCLVCGRVADVDVVPDPRWVSRIPVRGFHATGFRFELLGECSACREHWKVFPKRKEVVTEWSGRRPSSLK